MENEPVVEKPEWWNDKDGSGWFSFDETDKSSASTIRSIKIAENGSRIQFENPVTYLMPYELLHISKQLAHLYLYLKQQGSK